MKKLTQEEAQEVISKATVKVFQHRDAHYRLGQAIWNLIDTELTVDLLFTDADFFHDSDDAIALDKFYSNCVEN